MQTNRNTINVLADWRQIDQVVAVTNQLSTPICIKDNTGADRWLKRGQTRKFTNPQTILVYAQSETVAMVEVAA